MANENPGIVGCGCSPAGEPPAPDCSCFEAQTEALLECLNAIKDLLADLEVDIGDINIEELDVSASGLVGVERCTTDCQRVTLLFCKDENHAGGQGTDTDDGDINIAYQGYVSSTGLQVGVFPANLTDCSNCPQEVSFTTWSLECGCVDCKPVCWVQGIDSDGNLVYPDGAECPVYLDPAGGAVTEGEGTCTRIGSSKQIVGFGSSKAVFGPAGNTATATFQTNTGPGVSLLKQIQDIIANGDCQVAVAFFAGLGGVPFNPANATLTDAGAEHILESTLELPGDCCDDEIQAFWDESYDAGAAGDFTSAGIGCWNWTCTPGEPTEPGDCYGVLDPQPEPGTVVPGPCPVSCGGPLDVNIVNGPLDVVIVNPNPGVSCDSPSFIKECPPEPCPPPSEEIFCDGEGGEKYVIVTYASPVCGASGTFLASDYYLDPPVYTPYVPTAALICEDAVVTDQACVVDECGDRWTCVTILNDIDGTAVSSNTCLPYIEPEECADGEEVEGEGREAERVAKAEKVARKAIVGTLSAVASIKRTVAAINTTLAEVATVEDGEVIKPSPVGETCPCPCPDATQEAILDKLCELVDALTKPCDEEACELLDSGVNAPVEDGHGFSVFSGSGGVGTGIKISNVSAAVAASIQAAITAGHEVLIKLQDGEIFSASSITGTPVAGSFSLDGQAPVCGPVGVNGDGNSSSLTYEVRG